MPRRSSTGTSPPAHPQRNRRNARARARASTVWPGGAGEEGRSRRGHNTRFLQNVLDDRLQILVNDQTRSEPERPGREHEVLLTNLPVHHLRTGVEVTRPVLAAGEECDARRSPHATIVHLPLACRTMESCGADCLPIDAVKQLVCCVLDLVRRLRDGPIDVASKADPEDGALRTPQVAPKVVLAGALYLTAVQGSDG